MFNRVRELTISDALAAVLSAAMASSPEDSPYVFTQTMKRNKGKPYALTSVSQHFRRAKDELGSKTYGYTTSATTPPRRCAAEVWAST